MSHRLMTLCAMASLLSILVPNPSSGQDRDEESTTLTVLFDNFWTDDRLETGWGFAVLLETPEHTVLFDTGADGDVLLQNMHLAGKDPLDVEIVVISHAHGDHTGGMKALFDHGARPKVYLLEGFPAEMRRDVDESLEMILTEEGEEIAPGIRSTGQVGRDIPEQALVLETRDGPLLLTGCAHPGAVEMVRRAQAVAGQPVHTVLGGFHLMDADFQTIEGVLASFQGLGVQRAGPTHCSGLRAMEAFRTAYGENFQRLGVGRVLKIVR